MEIGFLLAIMSLIPTMEFDPEDEGLVALFDTVGLGPNSVLPTDPEQVDAVRAGDLTGPTEPSLSPTLRRTTLSLEQP